MKNIFSGLLLLLTVACSNKEVSLKQTQTGPKIIFSKDTMYVREKDPFNVNGNGIFQLQALPAAHQLHLKFYDSSGQIQFSYRGQALTNDRPVIVAGEWNTVFCSVNRSGLYAIEVSLKDQLGRSIIKKLMIHAAAAQRPSAKLSWRADDRDLGGKRFYFDASGSVQPYGKILSYHYDIAGQSITSSTDQLQYIFHQKGSYPLSFFVVDDLGKHSDTLNQTIDVL